MSAFSAQVCGFEPGRSCRIFKAEKILSTPPFGGEVKLSVPRCRFTACKRTLECIVEVGISRQNYRTSFLPTNSSTFRCFELSRPARRGETYGGKSRNRILYRVGTISLQAAVHPKYTLGALNMKEEEMMYSEIFIISYVNSTTSIYLWYKSLTH